MSRRVARSEVQPVPPKILRVRGTSTGLRVTLRLPAGLEPADLAAASERLRHAWGVHAVHVIAKKPGYVELRMTGHDLLRRVQMPKKARPRGLVVPVALRDDGTAYTSPSTPPKRPRPPAPWTVESATKRPWSSSTCPTTPGA
jgi:S-DNA-T family DNA segregation ATPase FtsK/SpoIIIE